MQRKTKITTWSVALGFLLVCMVIASSWSNRVMADSVKDAPYQAIVKINTYTLDEYNNLSIFSSGSGIIFDASGLVLTNYHVTTIEEEFDNSERETFMKEIGLNKTGLNQLIKEGYDLLNLDTFFTSGPEESRAWTVEKNTLAPKAASVIHTDFEKNFIRAEAVTCEDFIKYGSAEKCKENGKLRIEGKDYIVKDGDVLHFRVNP